MRSIKLQLHQTTFPMQTKQLLLLLAFFITAALQAQLIKNVIIVDGTGTAGYNGAVRIEGNKIKAVGQLTPLPDEQVIDGKGKVLAPGFIDSHSHHYGSLLDDPTGIAVTSQGVTTIVSGQDGESDPVDSIASFFSKHPVAINVATYTGHSSLREKIMGENNVFRKATVAEVEQMKILLKADMVKGSLGLSSGLEYEQAFFSSREEVLELAKTAAAYNGRYISHIRSEDITLEDALDEIIQIGRITKMPVQISHLKISMVSKWGRSNEFLSLLENARAEGINITADVYPYNFWNSTLRVLFPKRDYTSLASAEFAVRETFNADASYLVKYAPVPAYKGKTIGEISIIRKESAAQTIINLIQIAADFKAQHPEFKGSIEAIAAKGMNDRDVANFISWPQSNICSDGSPGGHPRAYGTFPRILAKYVREEKQLSLENAVYKMTGLTAEHLGFTDRGLITPGYYADLVLFDPATVKDNATIQNSKALSTGIAMVWVSGQLVFQDQQATGILPGTFIKRK